MADETTRPRFSIQKHDAADFHYVLRLEVDGVVLSFAVPRGPSPDPRVKRLAIPVDEELPMDFEGKTSASTTGSTKIIVWDSGEYSVPMVDDETYSATQSLEDGKFDFVLHGQKLQGGFTLIRAEEGANERWLLFKSVDASATGRRNPVISEPLSVLSGRDLDDVND